jgi:FlaA1/EpsC-like NDP-sugar epimerase
MQEFYRDKTVFLTGATGFLGKGIWIDRHQNGVEK